MSISRRSALNLGGFLGLSLAIGPGLRASAKTSLASLDALWTDLEKDEETASRALLKLADQRKDAVEFLAKEMKPLRVDGDWLQVRLERLGSKDEEVWRPAFEELDYFDPRLGKTLEVLMDEVKTNPARSRLAEVLCGRDAEALKGKNITLRKFGGENGEPMMFNFFADNVSFWAEPRIDKINSRGWGTIKKKWTRAVRAIVLLEHIGSPEAVTVLKTMTTGDPDAQPTRSAKEALDRLSGKKSGTN